MPTVDLVPQYRTSVVGLKAFWRLVIFLLSNFMILFVITWITMIMWFLQSSINSRKLRYPFVYFIPKQKFRPRGTSFAKCFKFAGSLCLMRSCLNWFISIVDVSSKANESITGVGISLNSPSFWLNLLHDIFIAFEALTTYNKTFWSMLLVDCSKVAKYSLQISGLHSCALAKLKLASLEYSFSNLFFRQKEVL